MVFGGGPKNLGLGSFANLFLRFGWQEEKWLAREVQNSFIYQERHQPRALIGRLVWGLCRRSGGPTQSARHALAFHALSSPYPHNVSLSIILRFWPKFWTKFPIKNLSKYSYSWDSPDFKNIQFRKIFFELFEEIPYFVILFLMITVSPSAGQNFWKIGYFLNNRG